MLLQYTAPVRRNGVSRSNPPLLEVDRSPFFVPNIARDGRYFDLPQGKRARGKRGLAGLRGPPGPNRGAESGDSPPLNSPFVG